MKDLKWMTLLYAISMAAFGCNAAPLNENLSKITLPDRTHHGNRVLRIGPDGL
jgi:hypothetical protein